MAHRTHDGLFDAYRSNEGGTADVFIRPSRRLDVGDFLFATMQISPQRFATKARSFSKTRRKPFIFSFVPLCLRVFVVFALL